MDSLPPAHLEGIAEQLGEPPADFFLDPENRFHQAD
jgi:hypothetical protein